MKRATLFDAALLLFAVLPLLLVAHPPLLDLPNHLARQYVIADLPGSAALAQYYAVHWVLVPNLALDLLVYGLRHLMSIDASVRFCCVLALVLLFAGVRGVNRWASAGQGRLYRIAPLFFYCGPFQYGFINFMLATGLAVCVLALYVRTQNRRAWWDKPLLAVLGAVTMVAHLVPFVLLAVAIASIEAQNFALAWAGAGRRDGWPLLRRGTMRAAACCVPALLIYAVFVPASYAPVLARASSLRDKAVAVAALTVFASPWQELAMLGIAAGLLGVALVAGAVRLHRAGWLMAAGFLLLFLAAPRSSLGSGFVDYRIPAGCVFFLLGLLVPAGRPRAWHSGMEAVAAGLVVWRVVLVGTIWWGWQARLEPMIAALRQVPVGARLLVVQGDPGTTTAARNPPLDHVAAYAVAYRQAFEPQIFASTYGQLLQLRPAVADLGTYLAPAALQRIDPRFGYVLVLRPGFAHVAPGLGLVGVAAGADFELYRVGG